MASALAQDTGKGRERLPGDTQTVRHPVFALFVPVSPAIDPPLPRVQYLAAGHRYARPEPLSLLAAAGRAPPFAAVPQSFAPV